MSAVSRSALVIGRDRSFILMGTLLLLTLVTAPVAMAQTCAPPATIAADRPGNLTAPLVVPKGFAQVEAGWSAAHAAGDVAQNIGATLVRVGITCRAELRVASFGWAHVRTGAGDVSSGMADAWLGTKVRLASGAGARPHLGLFVGSLVPVGGAFSHRRAEPEADLSAMWDLPRGQSALLYAGGASRWDGTGRVLERLTGASWGFPINAKAASFLEYSEYARPHAQSRYLTTGLQFFPDAVVQLDGYLSFPVPRHQSDVTFGVGLSRRW